MTRPLSSPPVADTPAVDPAEILVAIPVLNEEAHIAATLAAIMDCPGMEQVRVVVADGGSRDRTPAIVREMALTRPNLRLVDNPGRLQSVAVNLVVETCAEPRHRILVRVDAHAHYPPDYVLRVASSLRARGVAALATVMDSGGTGCFQRGAAWAMETRAGSGGSGHRGGTRSGYVDHGHHAGFDLAAFRAVGGYDTRFVANEDAELDHRIGRAGGRIWLDATIRIGYVMRPTPAALARQYWRYGVGRAQTVKRHRMRPRLRQMLPPLVVLACLAGLLAAPWAPAALLLPGLYAGALAALTLREVLRRRSACALWVGPALAAMHGAWGMGFLTEMARPGGWR
ncbi:glycosyltransferase family 2 protein [Roseivivax isoporae]|uniref:glycosyltransferase family 2 protein n=1 Tax=Roseivivax isoporae TaxID=591206 RepID=UPI0004B21B84|nr:glycosyltransferase family 2 protein [Roseivivax isoporae]